MKESALRQAALHYHASGLPVVPVGLDKKACATWGYWRKQKQTEEEVRSFPWEKLHGLALLTWPGSDFIVLDFDGPHAEQVWQDKAQIPLPETAINHTKSGGAHRIFRVPAGAPHPGAWEQGTGDDLRRKVRLVAAADCGCKKPCGVDLLLNGYFVAPPTPGYREDPDHPFEPGQCAVLPQAVLDYARTHERPAAPVKKDEGESWFSLALRGPIPEGQRNDTATRLAGLLLAKGHSREHALALLRPWAQTVCAPPMDERELQTTVQSVARLEARRKDEPAELPTLDAPVPILRRLQDQPDPIPTGIAELDARLRGGMRPGKALVIGGTPFAGKTALGIQMARAAAEAGCAVVVFLADEGREPGIIRLGQQLGYIREQIEDRLDSTLDSMERDLSKLILTFPDPDADADTTIEGLAEALVRAHPDRRKVLLLDSIQTVRTRHPLKEVPSIRERVMENARTARRLAVEYGLAVIYTSEVNRSWYRSRKEEDRASDLAAFAEARIEFSGDVLLAMRASDEDSDLVDVRIPKNRLGTRFPLLLRLNQDRASFVAVDSDPREAARGEAQNQKVAETRATILRELQGTPGLTRTELYGLVGGKKGVFDDALRGLRSSGIVKTRKGSRGNRVEHYLAEIPDRDRPGPDRDPTGTGGVLKPTGTRDPAPIGGGS
jgi:archaellum biogenesis ATPase FlaH